MNYSSKQTPPRYTIEQLYDWHQYNAELFQAHMDRHKKITDSPGTGVHFTRQDGLSLEDSDKLNFLLFLDNELKPTPYAEPKSTATLDQSTSQSISSLFEQAGKDLMEVYENSKPIDFEVTREQLDKIDSFNVYQKELNGKAISLFSDLNPQGEPSEDEIEGELIMRSDEGSAQYAAHVDGKSLASGKISLAIKTTTSGTIELEVSTAKGVIEALAINCYDLEGQEIPEKDWDVEEIAIFTRRIMKTQIQIEENIEFGRRAYNDDSSVEEAITKLKSYIFSKQPSKNPVSDVLTDINDKLMTAESVEPEKKTIGEMDERYQKQKSGKKVMDITGKK